jgi:hypothetical protein
MVNELMMLRTPSVFQNGFIEEISALQTFHDLNLEICDTFFWSNTKGFYEKSAASGTD